MTKPVPLKTFNFNGGYFNTDRLAYPEDAMAEGSKNLLISGADSIRAFRGIKDTTDNSGRTMFTVADGWAALDDDGPTEGIGSIFNFINKSLFWIGGGDVNYNGTLLSGFTATANLQLSPRNGSTYTADYTAGLAQPDAPTVAARDPGAGFTGLLAGVYSFKIARVRSDTGGRSIASLASSVISCAAQTARLTFPALDSNGQDRWAIFATKAGFGGVGLHYLVEEIDDTDLSTIDSIARSYELEFADSDLLPAVAYVDDYPPPSGSFAARLENYVLVIGCFENAIASSIRNFPESFNPEHLAFLPDAPTAVLPEQQGNYLYISTPSSVHALAVAPSAESNPMILQTVWADTGVAHPHNWCQYEGVIFAFVSRQGAVTMDVLGSPSSEFALPVAKEMKDWDVADTVVLPCPDLNSVVYINNGIALLFNLQNQKWSAPIYISDYDTDEVRSGVVVNRRLQISLYDSGSTTYNLFEFDEQTGATATSWVAKSPDLNVNPSGRVNIYGVKGTYFSSSSGDTDIKLFVDYSDTAAKTLTDTAAGEGMRTTAQSRIRQSRKNAISVSIESTQSDFTKDEYPSNVTVYGTRIESSVVE